MNVEDQLKMLRPRGVPDAWKHGILARAKEEQARSVSWWEIFRLPRPLGYALAALWLVILALKGITPDTGLEGLPSVSVAEVREHQARLYAALDGNGGLYEIEEGAAHFRAEKNP
jgi:hypothetical protein